MKRGIFFLNEFIIIHVILLYNNFNRIIGMTQERDTLFSHPNVITETEEKETNKNKFEFFEEEA